MLLQYNLNCFLFIVFLNIIYTFECKIEFSGVSSSSSSFFPTGVFRECYGYQW